jgi:predicted pyridoxine 5'-phosphate oxidase superfamily flavin-nucleotide-binding protein
MKIEGTAREVLEKTEWVAIATCGTEGPHVVATWGEYINAIGFPDDRIVIPVGHMQQTEANLEKDGRIELLCGSRQVNGIHGPGKGCSITGTARMHTEGPDFDAVRSLYPWARAALIVTAEKVATQL